MMGLTDGTLISGFELVETGLTEDLGEILATDTETSMDPIYTFADALSLSVEINNPAVTVRYTLATVTLDVTGTKITADGHFANSSSAVFPSSPLSFTSASTELGDHGYLVLRAQAYVTATGECVGEPLVRRYWCQPFTIVVAGTLRAANLAGEGTGVSFGPHVDSLALFTEGYATLALTNVSASCSVRYAVGGNVTASSPMLSKGSQLEIAGSTDMLSLGCFSRSADDGAIVSAGVLLGRTWSAHFNSNLDDRIYGGNGTLKPLNAVTVATIPISQRWELPLFSKVGNTTMTVRQLLVQAGAVGISANTSIKLTATVVGGGGPGGGGDGGVATEIYWDLLTCYPLTVEVGAAGAQSSVSVDDDAFSSPGEGRDTKQKMGANSTSAGYPVRTTRKFTSSLQLLGKDRPVLIDCL